MKTKIEVKIRDKPMELIFLFFIAIAITIILFSSGCAEQEENSPEPAKSSADSGGVSAGNLTNIEWQWTGFQQSGSPENKTAVPDPENYTLAFFPDNTYYIKADCNGGSGNYALDGNNLTFDPPVMTLIACGTESMDSEYLSLLSDVNSATLENEQLILYSENAGQRMFFISGGQTEQKI